MTRYNFYNNLELFHKTKEIIQQEEQEKIQEDLNELKHYGTKGQKWGVRKWQNYDGTFNEAGKERYFGSKKVNNDKIGSFKVNFKKSSDNSDLGTRTFYTRDEYNKTLNRLDNKYGDDYYPAMTNDEYRKMYEETPLYGQNKIGGKSGDYHYSWHKGQMFNTEYQNPDGSLTKKGLKALNRAQKHPKWFTTKNVISEDLLHEWEKNMTKDQFKTDEDKAKEEQAQREAAETRINEIKSNVKTTKELSGSKINEQELKDIIEELNDFDKHDFERNHKEEYNKVADIGLDALNKAEDTDDYEKIGDDDSRMWFMWEDQTDGLGELAYLYTKGYSKNYIKQYLDTYNSLPYDEKRKYTDSYSEADFVASEFYRGGDAYIDALFDKGEEDQKIGGLFSKDDTKKAVKEAKKLEKELENAKYQDKQKIINDLINDDKYKDTIDDAIKPYVEKNKKNIDRVNEIFKDYEDDEINTLVNAGMANSLMNKWGDKNNNETMKELAGYAHYYLNDDGNQGDNTAEYLYATIDKGIKAKELGNLWDNLRYSNEEKNENIPSLKKDPFLSNLSDDTLKEIVTNKFESKFNKGSYWNLYNASDTASDPDDNVKKAYSEAKNISKKLNKSCGNTNGWDYFWKAVDNLNMGDMNYKDLSQADWDRINAEINKLKK